MMMIDDDLKVVDDGDGRWRWTMAANDGGGRRRAPTTKRKRAATIIATIINNNNYILFNEAKEATSTEIPVLVANGKRQTSLCLLLLIQ